MPERNPVEEGGKDERKRMDLSVAQVVASALAAVVGALLASELGVYGTIMGAAVVSVGATTGGAVFQHIFKRTGEQLRDAVDRGPNQMVNGLRQAPVDGAAPQSPPAISSEWSEPQVVRTRRRWTWRTYATVSGLVFVLAMTPIVAFELATGQPVAATVTGQTGNGTSFGGKVSTGTDTKPPVDEPTGRPSGGGREPGGVPSGGGGASAPATSEPRPEPSGSPSGRPTSGGSPSADPKPTPDPSPSGTPTSGTSPSAGDGGRPTGGASPQPSAPSQAPASMAPSGTPAG